MARTFLKNVSKEATTYLFKKQVVFFFTVVFRAMIHNSYLKSLLTLPLFFVFPFPLNFRFRFKVKFLL